MKKRPEQVSFFVPEWCLFFEGYIFRLRLTSSERDENEREVRVPPFA
ncbi:MAG: hypothetical protein GX840_00845 [Bacteroidales bacterium]|nr:hypothetical protein [Bacteroidales bacterium]